MNYHEALKLVPVKNGWFEDKCGNDELVVHYVDGKIHCEDGPAIFWDNGRQEWFQNDEPHRIDGPARIYPYGLQEYWQNGKRHRTDGPAVISNEYQGYWIEGKQLTEAEFNSRFAGSN